MNAVGIFAYVLGMQTIAICGWSSKWRAQKAKGVRGCGDSDTNWIVISGQVWAVRGHILGEILDENRRKPKKMPPSFLACAPLRRLKAAPYKIELQGHL